MRTKGQAAMEFLMTYGWAILAAIVAIGVLAYFGVFTPGKYAPTATVLNPPFTAIGAALNTTDAQLEIKNGLGESVNITSVAITGCTTDSTQVTVAADGSAIKSLACSLTSGDTHKADITITYRKGTSALDLRATGTMTERVA